MAPTYSNGQEMVRIYLIKNKITTKFFKFDLLTGRVQPTQDRWTTPENLHSQTIHVFDRTPYSNRETGVVGSPSHETYPTALEATLACPRNFGKGHFGSPVTPSSPRLVVGQEQCTTGPTSAPPSTRYSAVYRRL